MKIGIAIKQCRTRANLSQLQLAKKAKVSQGYIANVEKNNLIPSQKVVNRICDALGIPAIALVVLGTEYKDIKTSKKKIYTKLKPLLDKLVEQILTDTYGEPAN